MARLSLLVPASSQLRLEAIAKFFKLLGEAPVEESRLADRFSQISAFSAAAAKLLRRTRYRSRRSGVFVAVGHSTSVSSTCISMIRHKP